MPALPEIPKPTPFVKWDRKLFDDRLGFTETYVFDGDKPVAGVLPSERIAYGKCRKGFWFFISMTRAEEPEFWQVYLAWRTGNPAGAHHFVATSNGTRPPNCGTPNTPPCVTQIRVPPTEKCGTGCVCAEAA